MPGNYEFRHQSPRQKVVLYGLKGFVLVLLSFSLYSLVSGTDDSPRSQISGIASVFTSFWIYANLLQVKVEVQELFVPPMNIQHGIEFMLIGFVLYLVAFFV
ncbi:MAG: hypothetical protein ACFHX7_07815 [Pseudomonadota bacterium]